MGDQEQGGHQSFRCRQGGGEEGANPTTSCGGGSSRGGGGHQEEEEEEGRQVNTGLMFYISAVLQTKVNNILGLSILHRIARHWYSYVIYISNFMLFFGKSETVGISC